MKGFCLLKGSLYLFGVFALLATIVPVTAQIQVTPMPGEDGSVYTVQIPRDQLRISHVRVNLDNGIRPAGELPNPYVYLGSKFLRYLPTGGAVISFTTGVTGTAVYAEDVMMNSGPNIFSSLPIGAENRNAACISELTYLLFNNNTFPVSVTLNIRIYDWNGAVTSDPFLNVNYQADGVGPVNIAAQSLVLVTVALPTAPPVKLTKGSYVGLQVVGATGVGWVIGHGTPGNTAMAPSYGNFKISSNPTAFFGFASAQGNFFLAIRGTHNFVGQVDLGALSMKAQPGDPLAFEFDADAPPDGIAEGMRRNLLEVELTNDSGTPFTTRYTTYVDENGRFTLGLDNAVSQVTVRRMDNGLKVTFNRPNGGWSTDPCNPTDGGSATVTIGDVDGDNDIDDNDLQLVLEAFGLL